MEISNQPLLRFHSCDITNIQFDASRSKGENEDFSVDFNIVPKVFFPENYPDFFKIVMEVEVVGIEYFQLNLLAVGTFQLVNLSQENMRRNFVNANAPAIMFPYVRSFISTLTSNVGAAAIPITLPTQFFKGDLEIIK